MWEASVPQGPEPEVRGDRKQVRWRGSAEGAEESDCRALGAGVRPRHSHPGPPPPPATAAAQADRQTRAGTQGAGAVEAQLSDPAGPGTELRPAWTAGRPEQARGAGPPEPEGVTHAFQKGTRPHFN